MQNFVFLFIALLSTNALADEMCEARANLAGALAVKKFTVRESLREKPMSGSMAEVWRHLAFMSSEDYQKLGDSPEQVKRIAKLIAENDTSSDWRIDLLVFNEFFREVCEAKLDVLDIPSLDAKALGSCFGDVPPGKKDFSDCIRAYVSKISESTPTK
jgi:hypothetical protein